MYAVAYFEGMGPNSNYMMYAPQDQYMGQMGPGMVPPFPYGYMPMNMDGMIPMPMPEGPAAMYGPGGPYMNPQRLPPNMVSALPSS